MKSLNEIIESIELQFFKKLRFEKNIPLVSSKSGFYTSTDIPVINLGYSFNLSPKEDAEVVLLADLHKINNKFAFMSIPKTYTHKWNEGCGGIQSPVNKDRVLEFNSTRTHLRDKNIALGNEGAIEIQGNKVIIRGDLTVEGNLYINGNVMCSGEIIVGGDISSNSKVSAPILSGTVDEGSYGFSTINIPDEPFKDTDI